METAVLRTCSFIQIFFSSNGDHPVSRTLNRPIGPSRQARLLAARSRSSAVCWRLWVSGLATSAQLQNPKTAPQPRSPNRPFALASVCLEYKRSISNRIGRRSSQCTAAIESGLRDDARPRPRSRAVPKTPQLVSYSTARRARACPPSWSSRAPRRATASW